MYRSGLVDTLVTHANTKGFGLTSLSGVRCGFMPPQLKTNKQRFLPATENYQFTILTGFFHLGNIHLTFCSGDKRNVRQLKHSDY